MVTLQQARTDVTRLREALRGEYLDRRSAGYDEARAVYNAMIDKRPTAIVRCVDVADVIAALRHARDLELTVAVRSGGHNGAGFGTVDDGLVIDLAAMGGVIVDPKRRTATVQAGATLAAVDHATHAFGLAVPAGLISTTGIGGLTLGGGIGHLTRLGGLTIDNLLSAEVVLTDGTVVNASHEENDDLFWALRGGGGNFGIVTSFTFHCQEVANVIAGPVLYDIEDSAEMLSWWREFGPAKACGIVWCYSGREEDPACLREARGFGRPLLDGVQRLPLPALQSAFDGVYPPGDQWYWRADFFDRLPDEALERHIEHGTAMPTWKSTMHLYPIDGAASRVDRDSSPWAYRDAKWAEVIVGVDPDPANADVIRQWCVAYWEAAHPYSMGGAYV